jgi:hypothetical protein
MITQLCNSIGVWNFSIIMDKLAPVLGKYDAQVYYAYKIDPLGCTTTQPGSMQQTLALSSEIDGEDHTCFSYAWHALP